MFRVPDSVVTRRPISLQGVVVPAGTTLSKAQVEALGKGLNALLDSGFVVAAPDPFARKGKAHPRPTSLPPVIRNAMVGKLTGVPLSVSASVVGDAISVEVAGGVPSFTVTLDGGGAKSKSSRTFSFTGVGPGAHTVEVSDGSGATASVVVEVAEPAEPKKPHRKKDEAGE
jgi:hypothetical protein